MRILVTGAGGLLGGRLSSLLSPAHEVVGAIRGKNAPEGLPAGKVDLALPEEVESLLERARPDAVVHCAALADAEVCERFPEQAQRDNETATGILARACARRDARLIVISTDLVFEGNGSFWREDAPTRPVMEYGRSKRRAEAAAAEGSKDALILRVALVHGRGFGARLSASEGVARALGSGKTVTLYEDEWRTPIDPESVASAIEAVLARPGLRGTIHLGGPERLTRFEFGNRVAEVLGLDSSLLRPARQASHQGAPRARDVSLDTARARAELGWAPRALAEGIREGR